MRASVLLLASLAIPALSQIKRDQDPASAISGAPISPSTVTITGTGYSIQATNGNVYAKYGVTAATGNFTGALRVVGELNGGAATTSGIFQLGAGPNGFDGARMNLCGSASASCGGTGALQYFTKGNATADHIWYTDQGGGAVEQMRINGGYLKLMNATPFLIFDTAAAGYITSNGDLNINIDNDSNGSNLLRVRGNSGGVELLAVTEAGAATLDVNGSAQFGSGATKSTFSATGALTLASGAAFTATGNGNIGGAGANNSLVLDSASGFTQLIMRRGGASKWSINNNVDGTDFFNIQNETGGFSAAALTPAGLFRPRIRTAAQIHAITPDILGGIVVCSDCTRPYTICVATGTASADQFREQGETTGCY